nr:MAG TPA: hypothetical protein [Caudoviricetes sp.]
MVCGCDLRVCVGLATVSVPSLQLRLLKSAMCAVQGVIS